MTYIAAVAAVRDQLSADEIVNAIGSHVNEPVTGMNDSDR